VTTVFRSSVLVLSVIGLLVTTVGASARPDLTGFYRSLRVTPEGQTSRGFVRIVAHAESYLVSWMLSPPVDEWVDWDPDFIGLGVVRDDVLAVSYFGEDMAGVVLYRIEGDDRLTGEWTAAGGDGRVGTEVLTRADTSTASAGPAHDR
jgi:hypothetical protein